MTQIIITNVSQWKQAMKPFYVTIEDFLPEGRVFLQL
jgi:hypothetical protein